jgi:hypothetical protein
MDWEKLLFHLESILLVTPTYKATWHTNQIEPTTSEQQIQAVDNVLVAKGSQSNKSRQLQLSSELLRHTSIIASNLQAMNLGHHGIQFTSNVFVEQKCRTIAHNIGVTIWELCNMVNLEI